MIKRLFEKKTNTKTDLSIWDILAMVQKSPFFHFGSFPKVL